MFTGIIRGIGTIKKIERDGQVIKLTIDSSLATEKNKGDSISVDGVCLTITSKTDVSFTVDVIPESISRTIINTYKEGTKVNLENPLKYGDHLDGHMVSGHIDYVGKVIKVDKRDGETVLTVNIPEAMTKYFAVKGSVTVNGVSLTISNLSHTTFSVSLIPETLSNTNLDTLKGDNTVNIEIDLISRYLESLLNNKEKEVTYDFLKERGFL